MKLAGLLFDPSPEYVAGFFDGDGSVSITKAAVQRGAWSARYYLSVNLTNTNRSILELVVEIYGGCIKEKPHKEGWKTAWLFAASHRGAAQFLTSIAPYVFIKRERVELALEFQSWNNSLGSFRGVGVPKEIAERREVYFLRMKELNKRGVS